MMAVLLFAKALSLFSESMRFYYMKQHGDTLTSWNTVYYIFMFIKVRSTRIVLLLSLISYISLYIIGYDAFCCHFAHWNWMDFIKGILKDWKSPIDSYDTYDSNLLLFKASSQRN